MTDTEYDIIDELYFVTAYPEIKHNLGLPDETIAQNLQVLITQGYIKCFYPDPDTEIEFEAKVFAQNYRNYFYLASKAGLLAHNSR